jgi:hypothetical protein
MKKVLFAVAAIAVIGLSSCKECVDCSGVSGQSGTKICKSDYDDAGTGISWSTYKAALQASGCK